MIRLHLPFPFHTTPDPVKYSHCAFTSRAILFSKMMGQFGYDVIEYGNDGENSLGPDVTILSRDEHARFYPPLAHGEFWDKHCVLGTEAYNLFCQRLSSAMADIVKPGDIVLHPFGRPHTHLVKRFKQAIHVEPFVGYNDAPFGAFRIFESEAWRHYHLGRWELMRDPRSDALMFPAEPGLAHNLSWVIPNARDPEDWPLGTGQGDYVLFMGRLCKAKGLDTAANIIKAWHRKHPDDSMKFVFAGQGDISGLVTEVQREARELIDVVDYRGVVTGRDRARLIGDARCMICPTNYVEPGGGSAIEALMCGTPVVASDWGCFTESVRHGFTGYLCKTLADWIAAIESTGKLWKRESIQAHAVLRFGTAHAAPLYDRCFRQLRDLLANGPVSTTSFNVP